MAASAFHTTSLKPDCCFCPLHILKTIWLASVSTTLFQSSSDLESTFSGPDRFPCARQNYLKITLLLLPSRQHLQNSPRTELFEILLLPEHLLEKVDSLPARPTLFSSKLTPCGKPSFSLFFLIHSMTLAASMISSLASVDFGGQMVYIWKQKNRMVKQTHRWDKPDGLRDRLPITYKMDKEKQLQLRERNVLTLHQTVASLFVHVLHQYKRS
jgi:hypothetical protein